MALAVGARLGPFDMTGSLGVGGPPLAASFRASLGEVLP
jgi:hypothetical protein